MPKERKSGKSRSRGRRGFDNTVGQQSHTRILPVAKSNNLRLLFPEPGVTHNSTTVRFSYKSAPNEFFRFTRNPIIVTYVLLCKNPDFKENATEPEKRITHVPVKAEEGKPPVYLDPNNRLAAFFSSAEVKISGETISLPWMINDYQGIYQAANRSCLSDDDRAALFGEKFNYRTYKNRHYQKVAPPGSSDAVLPPDIKEKYRELSFGEAGAYQYKTIKESLDGVPLLGMPKCFALCKMLGEDYLDQQNQFLVPGTEVNVSLHKTTPGWKYFENGEISDDKYFGQGDWPSTSFYEMKIDYDGIFLEYETLELMPDQAAKAKALLGPGRSLQFVDVPRITFQAMSAGDTISRHTFTVQAGSKLGFLATMYSHSFIPDISTNKTCSTKFHLPENLQTISCRLDSDEMIFHGGLEHITKYEKANSSISARQLYHWLLDHKLTTRTFREFHNIENPCYDRLIPLNFTNFDCSHDRYLHVELTFAAPQYIPPNLQLMYLEIKQAQICNNGKDSRYNIKIVGAHDKPQP